MIYNVTYSETITYQVTVVADSEDEAKDIVGSGETDSGWIVDSEYNGIDKVVLVGE